MLIVAFPSFQLLDFGSIKNISSQHTGLQLYQIWTSMAMVLDKSGLVERRLQGDAKLSLLCACMFTNNTSLQSFELHF